MFKSRSANAALSDSKEADTTDLRWHLKLQECLQASSIYQDGGGQRWVVAWDWKDHQDDYVEVVLIVATYTWVDFSICRSLQSSTILTEGALYLLDFALR